MTPILKLIARLANAYLVIPQRASRWACVGPRGVVVRGYFTADGALRACQWKEGIR